MHPAEQIQRMVARRHRVAYRALRGRDRTVPVVRARHAAMRLCRDLLRMSYPEIGRRFDRDHTTVIFAVRKVELDPQFVDSISRRLRRVGKRNGSEADASAPRVPEDQAAIRGT